MEKIGVEPIKQTTDFENLMQNRIRKVLLICSSYDAFTLEEDGRIENQINREYLDLNLSSPPKFKRVSSAMEAMAELEKDSTYDLIISMFNIGEIDVFSFSKMVKSAYPDIPFVLMITLSREIRRRIEVEDTSSMDYIFCWHGNADLILAIIKIIEDKMNADVDILQTGVQCILLIEDSVRYYSTYLPVIYKLLLNQSGEFLKEALNEQQQKLRKRGRPKILMATDYCQAVQLYQRYKSNMLGVISDVGFKVDNRDKAADEKLDAGIDLCRLVKEDNPLMPFLLQSSQESMRSVAEELGVGFIAKYSKTLLMELGDYINNEFAFGEFIFRDPDTNEVVGRAKDLREMQTLIYEIPDKILLYHSSQNHLSKWLFARGLFSLGKKWKMVSYKSFATPNEMRQYMSTSIREYRSLLGQGVIARFNPDTYNEYIWFARIGEGSLGGKARGLAFINNMLQNHRLFDKYEGVQLLIPRTVVVATDYFDDFIRINGLKYVINSEASDTEILSEFVSSRLPDQLVHELRAFIRCTPRPLAIRSSSKLEDSHYQPFAGIYSTYMIPYTGNEDQMLRLLGKAIKSVYASIYYRASRAYINATANVLAEEKMAIVIQEICGTEDSGYFFPTFSGVARSLNFYPLGDEKPEDGIATIAYGLGKLVVEGGVCLRFSPKYPKKALQTSTPKLARSDTQQYMYAMSIRPEEFITSIDDAVNIRKIDIQKASEFRNIKYVASTWDADNDRIADGCHTSGTRLITFNSILKYGTMPLAQIISDMLTLAEHEMQCPVEIEFAANMDVPTLERTVFNFLQIRPIVESEEYGFIDWSKIDTKESIIYAESALGVGQIDGITDFIYVKTGKFDSAHTQKMVTELEKLNVKMTKENRNYVLIGPGRWGSSDPWLGIPIKWSQISAARVIVECGLENFRIDPSQGTHFFQNLTSFGVGYLTINPFMGDGSFDSAYLDSLPAEDETEYFRHVKLEEPLYIYIDGKNNRGIIKTHGEYQHSQQPTLIEEDPEIEI